MFTRTADADPPVYTITRFGDDIEPEPAAGDSYGLRLRPWERALCVVVPGTIAAAVAVTVETGTPGWTAALFVADVAATLGAVVHRAHVEASVYERPATPIEAALTDPDGTVTHYTIRPGSMTEAA